MAVNPISRLTVKGVTYTLQDERVDEILDQLHIDPTELIDDDSVSLSKTWSSSKVSELIQSIVGLKLIVVNSLPSSDIDTNAIYLLPKQNSEQNNVKDEYVYIGEGNEAHWEKIGDTTIDLSEYATKVYVEASYAKKTEVYTKTEVDNLLRNIPDEDTTYLGDNVTIEINPQTNVISAKISGIVDSEIAKSIYNYTAGSNKIKVDNINRVIDLLAPTSYTAGSNRIIINEQERTIDVNTQNLPSFSQVNSDWTSTSGASEILNKPNLATVATSGNYNDLSNKPTIPDSLSDLSDDNTHRLVTDTEKTTWNNKSDFSGSYNDLTNKPTIPDVTNMARIRFIAASSIQNNLNNITTTGYQTNDIVCITSPSSVLTFGTGNNAVTLYNIPFEPMFRWNGTQFIPMFYFVN